MGKFLELVESANKKATDKLGLPEGFVYNQEEFEANRLVLNKLMSPKTLGQEQLPKIDVTEALHAADASILIPKVISDVLIRPLEPNYIGQTILSRTINVDSTRSIEFPSLGAIQAYDMGDTQEYKEQLPGFTEHPTEIKVNKVGLMLSLSEEIIADSMWDVIALYLEAAGYAMIRKKEQKIFTEYSNKAITIFDNTIDDVNAQTRGKASDQSANGSLSMVDLLDVMGAMIANDYNPTDMVLHPLGWTVFAKDPILRFQMLWKGGIGVNFGQIGPDPSAIQANAPFGVATQVTPFAPFLYNTTLDGPLSGLGASNVCDINILDRRNPLLILQREPMSQDNQTKWERDIRQLKLRERYGLGVLNGGRAVTAIKNIRLVDNMEAMYTINTIVP